jgi:2-amino-4-hydroxy-6-hydroxymethyldihydropteridine diphosphokinase
MAEALIALGSNVGAREEHLRYAVERLGRFGSVRAVSSFHETEPAGFAAQGLFLNAALALETALGPRELMREMLRIEAERGRERRILNGPRTLDLDLLFYENLVMDEPGLTLPHPRMHERLFVLAPLAEVAPEAVHPVLQRSVRELLEEAQRRESRLRG